MGYFPAQLAWSSGLWFYCLNRDCNGHACLIFHIQDYLRWNQRLYRAFIADEVFITPGSGLQKHLKIKGTRNYYFKTIGYCSRTKVKSSPILRRFYATWPWALTLGLKCYYLWELYHAWVLVITLVLSTNVARSTGSTMGLV